MLDSLKLFIFALPFLILGICSYGSIELNEAKSNIRQEISHYEKLAKEGDIDAQKQLARIYAEGETLWVLFVPVDLNYGQDFQKSAYWYEKLAMRGDKEAQYDMAMIWEGGKGVDINMENANAWYYKAALQDYVAAQYKLAQNFESGNGVPQINNDAVYWYNKAAENGYSDAIYKMGVIYDDGLLGVSENNQTALSWFEKLDDSYKNKHQDLSMRLISLKTPVQNYQDVQAGVVYKEGNSGTSNKDYPSKYYGKDKEPTALCRDGTYSYSLGRRGVCSRHGGVKYWF